MYLCLNFFIMRMTNIKNRISFVHSLVVFLRVEENVNCFSYLLKKKVKVDLCILLLQFILDLAGQCHNY